MRTLARIIHEGPATLAHDPERVIRMPVAFRVVASGAINAGVKARQGRGGKVLVDPVAVPLVLCGNSDGHCIAIVELSADKADAVAKQFSDADVSLQAAPAQILARAAGSCVTRRH